MQRVQRGEPGSLCWKSISFIPPTCLTKGQCLAIFPVQLRLLRRGLSPNIFTGRCPPYNPTPTGRSPSVARTQASLGHHPPVPVCPPLECPTKRRSADFTPP